MKLGFIKSNFQNERRVPLLPEDIHDFQNEIIIESGFGANLEIPDSAYAAVGCQIRSRQAVFTESAGIFSLKAIQPNDYPNIRPGQIIIGWTHPTGSGRQFMTQQANPKQLVVVDLDNTTPRVYARQQSVALDLPKDFIERNSFYAGYAGTIHALLSFGLLPEDSATSVAILGTGNAAQGAAHAISKFTSHVRMFNRRTLPECLDNLASFDIVINGIEVGADGTPILSLANQAGLNPGCLIIDIAADAGNAIQGNHFTYLNDPIYEDHHRFYYTVPNVPSLVYRNISPYLSRRLSRYIFTPDIKQFQTMTA